MFNTAQLFNMQVSGVTPKDIDTDKQLHKLIKPVATFSSHKIEDEKDQFIAIAEGIDLPLYAFTYAIEMIQFYHEDPDAFTGTNDEVTLDHSIVARHHAQEIATLIADEARLCHHYHQDPEDIYSNLMRHQKEVSISYQTLMGGNPMPKGMNEYDIYLLQ